MAYTPFHVDWVPWPSTATIVSSAFLEYIEAGLVDAASDADTALARAIPAGGASGTFLKKNSATDYDDVWAALVAGDIPNLTSSKITDFTEASQDVIGAMVAAAGGTYDDGAGTITLPGGSAPVTTSFSTTATWRSPRPQSNLGGATTADQLVLAPVPVPRALTLTGLGCRVSTGQASSTVHLCIYGDNGSFMPGSRLAMTSAMASTASGVVGETFSGVALAAGIYWIGFVTHGATAPSLELAAGTTNAGPINDWAVMPHGTGATPTINAGNDGYAATQTGQASPPATFGGSLTTDHNTGKIPAWIAMKVNR